MSSPGSPALQRAATVSALAHKAYDLVNYANGLVYAAPHQSNPALFMAEASSANLEAAACKAKAYAINTGGAFNFPGAATLSQLAANCFALETAIATSATWTSIIAAGHAVTSTMAAATV